MFRRLFSVVLSLDEAHSCASTFQMLLLIMASLVFSRGLILAPSLLPPVWAGMTAADHVVRRRGVRFRRDACSEDVEIDTRDRARQGQSTSVKSHTVRRTRW